MSAGSGGAERRAIAIGDRTVLLSNPGKVLYPAVGFTKSDVVEYYLAVAPALLPHLDGHPVTLARFPDGVDAEGWYQTNCPPGHPGWLRVEELRGGRGQRLRYCVLDEPAALAWAANAGALELHPLLGPADRAARALVLDLDPGAGAGLAECARVALRVRARLASAGLVTCAKTSGAKGLHLHVALDGAAGFEAVKAFARALARDLSKEEPALVTERMPIAERVGKVLVDWRQNDPNLSLIAPYSLRAATVPVVAAPLRWDEVEEAASSKAAADRLHFGPHDVLLRLAREGDLLAPALSGGGRLPAGRPDAAPPGWRSGR